MGSFGLLAAFSTIMCLVITCVVLLMLWLVRAHGRGLPEGKRGRAENLQLTPEIQ